MTWLKLLWVQYFERKFGRYDPSSMESDDDRLSPTDLETTKLDYANEENFEILVIDNLTNID